MSDFLAHKGVAHDENPPGRGSGRYGWGSGENPGQHQYNFISEVTRFRKRGMSNSEIAKAMLGEDASIADLKAEIAIQRTNERRADVYRARQLLEECGGNVSEVGRRMGKNESSVRKLLDENLEKSQDKYKNTAELLKDKVDKKGVIDIGPGSEISMNVTSNTMAVAVAMLEKEGYIRAKAQIPQQTSNNKTTVTVLCPPGTEYTTHTDLNGKKSNYINWKENPIHTISDYSPDEGKTYDTLKTPSNLDSSRIQIRYDEQGGSLKDGVIEIRRGTPDLDLGKSQYAQVRIAVDGKYYLKGMAMYADPKDMPPGVDIIYNSNKKEGTPASDVFKPLKTVSETSTKIDWDNPFGALIKRDGQSFYKDKDGKYVQNENGIFTEAKKGDKGERYSLSPINKIREEGEWDTWSKTLASQFLSKQPVKVIKQQIDISLADKKSELADIMNLTNPVIKQQMLKDFSDKCDSNAADLSVKGFKNQVYQVLLPVTNMKDNEIYAPQFKDGDTVALIRYPHGGIFEIPILKVNNKNPSAKKIMQNARDAVGITPTTAEKLSGADFDGDFAAVIPLKSNKLSIASMDTPENLKGFNTKIYKLPNDAPRITNKTKQTEMGKITNLITDMTAQGANIDDIVLATKHSMVVIDSEKHHLDIKQSAKDCEIARIQKEWQTERGGAATIFSRSNKKIKVNQLKEVTDTKKMTPQQLKDFKAGKKIFVESGKMRSDYKVLKDRSQMTPEQQKAYDAGKKIIQYTGDKVPVQQEVKMRSLYKDAMDLVRDPNNPKEVMYAKYSNELSALADQARREMRAIKPVPVNQTAKKTYAAEVAKLNADLKVAKSNQERERVATNIAAIRSAERIKDNPYMDYEHKSRIRAQEMQKARDEVGAHKKKIDISDREWDAIQANAISTNKLKEIIANTDKDAFVKRALPKDNKLLITDSKINLMKTMYDSGMYTQKEIAEKFGISASTVSKAVKGEL